MLPELDELLELDDELEELELDELLEDELDELLEVLPVPLELELLLSSGSVPPHADSARTTAKIPICLYICHSTIFCFVSLVAAPMYPGLLATAPAMTLCRGTRSAVEQRLNAWMNLPRFTSLFPHSNPRHCLSQAI